MNQLLRVALVCLMSFAVSACIPGGPDDDGDSATEEPSVSNSRLAAAVRFDPDEACDMLGIGSVPALGETYNYEVLEATPNDTGCSQEIARVAENDFRVRNVMIMGHGQTWGDDTEAAQVSFRDEVEDPGSSLYNALEPDLAESENLDGDWDEGVVVSAPDWEIYPEFRIEVREGPVVLSYWITLSSNRTNDTECAPEITEGCVIGYEIISAWIQEELLPEALANLQDAGYVDS